MRFGEQFLKGRSKKEGDNVREQSADRHEIVEAGSCSKEMNRREMPALPAR